MIACDCMYVCMFTHVYAETRERERDKQIKFWLVCFAWLRQFVVIVNQPTNLSFLLID